MKIRYSILGTLIFAGLVVAACSIVNEPVDDITDDPTQNIPNEPTRVLLDGDFIPGHQGEFTTVDVFILESFPVQVQAQVSGYLMNGCVELVDVTSERDGNTFALTLNTRRPAGDVMCTEALVPFETTVSLDVYGLPAGNYTVIAGEQWVEFVLTADNELQDGPVSCPEPDDGESQVQAIDREAGVGFCFLIPEGFVQAASEDERTWVIKGPMITVEDATPSLTITLTDLESQSFEAWTESQSGRLKLPQGQFDDRIMLYQGIALDVEDWPDQVGTRIQWIPAGGYVFQLTFTPLNPGQFPLATEAMETLYESVLGSWLTLGK